MNTLTRSSYLLLVLVALSSCATIPTDYPSAPQGFKAMYGLMNVETKMPIGEPYVITLVEEDKTKRTWRYNNGQEIIMRRVFPSGGYTPKYLAEKPDAPEELEWNFAKLFPLKVGNKDTESARLRKQIKNFPLGAPTETCTVTGREWFESTAGKYRAYRVLCEWQSFVLFPSIEWEFLVHPDVPVFLQRRKPHGFLGLGIKRGLVLIAFSEHGEKLEVPESVRLAWEKIILSQEDNPRFGEEETKTSVSTKDDSWFEEEEIKPPESMRILAKSGRRWNTTIDEILERYFPTEFGQDSRKYFVGIPTRLPARIGIARVDVYDWSPIPELERKFWLPFISALENKGGEGVLLEPKQTRKNDETGSEQTPSLTPGSIENILERFSEMKAGHDFDYLLLYEADYINKQEFPDAGPFEAEPLTNLLRLINALSPPADIYGQAVMIKVKDDKPQWSVFTRVDMKRYKELKSSVQDIETFNRFVVEEAIKGLVSGVGKSIGVSLPNY